MAEPDSQVAEDLVSNSTRSLLLEMFPKGLASIATWADQVKNQPEYAWTKTSAPRYCSVQHNPPQECSWDFRRDCPDGCVVSAISDFAKNDSESLKFLIHFVADMHQPLHMSGPYFIPDFSAIG
jgi:hypothetical protein